MQEQGPGKGGRGVQPGGYWGEKRVVSLGPWALATQLADPGTHVDFDSLRSNSSRCSRNILLSYLVLPRCSNVGRHFAVS